MELGNVLGKSDNLFNPDSIRKIAFWYWVILTLVKKKYTMVEK